MFLLIDNYDSFTYNLVQEFQKMGRHPLVLRNDAEELLTLAADPALERVVISPGPSRPENAGLCLEFVKRLPKTVPTLGVCLGHQVLGFHAGATVGRAARVMHGKTSRIRHDGRGLFEGLPDDMACCRYHSLLVRAEERPETLAITATAADAPDEVMAMRYKDRPWFGVQFHPESILSPEGPMLLANFMKETQA